ncbi:MAG: hypothetical protein CMP44_04230 [Rickettsiales bacterium]|jgi:hypothetical protein|nr:hypothetical protein [Rickettsiales bacterium]
MKNFYLILNYLFKNYFLLKNLIYVLFLKLLCKKTFKDIKLLKRNFFVFENLQLELYLTIPKRIKQKILLKYTMCNLNKNLLKT